MFQNLHIKSVYNVELSETLFYTYIPIQVYTEILSYIVKLNYYLFIFFFYDIYSILKYVFIIKLILKKNTI